MVKRFGPAKKEKRNKEKHYLLVIPVNEVVKLDSRTWSTS